LKDSKKTLHITKESKDKYKKLKDKFNCKRKDFSNLKEKINDGKWWNNIMTNLKIDNK